MNPDRIVGWGAVAVALYAIWRAIKSVYTAAIAVHQILEDVAWMKAELSPNGGTTLRDKVDELLDHQCRPHSACTHDTGQE
jgi:hypothetical protein